MSQSPKVILDQDCTELEECVCDQGWVKGYSPSEDEVSTN
jgi:hypothetical protein